MSVTTFEAETENLTEQEKHYIATVIKVLRQITEPRKSQEVCELIQLHIWNDLEDSVRFTPVRLRKYVNHIRLNGLLPVIATSEGYFVSYNREVIEKQIKSLNERASSIRKCADGLTKFIGP